MPHRIVLLAGLLGLAVPASANAATLTTDHPCYVEKDPVTYTGAGFAPGAEWEIEAFAVFQHGTVAPDGSFTVQDAAPLNTDENTKAKSVTVNGHQEDASGNPVVATVSYKVVSFLARPSHGAGNPRGFTRWGFSGFTPGKQIYIHVKRGSHVWTQRVGRASQPCGIAHTRLRRLPAVPASAVRSGHYRVIVDSNRKLRNGSRRYVIPYSVF